MATLNKIRAKSGLLIALIAFALFAFILGDLFKSGSSILRGDQMVVGVIDGKEINFQEFNPEVSRALDLYKRQGLSSVTQVSNIVWSNLERKTLIDKEVEKLGLNIGADELWNLIITDPSIASSPSFANEYGIFDQNKVKQYIASVRENATSNAQVFQLWAEWLNFEKGLKERGIVNSYYDLISAGLNATDLDGKMLYHNQGDYVDAKYVYLPFSSVNDTLARVSDEEVISYMQNNEDDYKVEASRDLMYVLFEIKPSLADETEIKEELTSLIEDKVIYNNQTSAYDTIPGFKNVKEDSLFVNRNSDEKYSGMYFHKGKLSEEVEKFAFSANKGDVYGPYVENDFIKISKLVDAKVIADSVKASHILISFVGSRSANQQITRSDAEAKAIADSLANILNSGKANFSDLAKDNSEGPTASKGGDLGWFTYGTMVPEFNSFVFNNKAGKIGVVKTVFGYHVVKVEDVSKKSNAVKIATISRKVIPSEETDRDFDSKASNFAIQNTNLESFRAAAVTQGLEARNVEGIKQMDFSIPGIGNQRDIVRWVFDEETKVNDSKLFNVDQGYVVAIIYNKNEAGLMEIDIAKAQIGSKLINEKKAAILSDKFEGDNLEDIAKNAGTSVKDAKVLYFQNPIITSVGREPKVVGTIFGLEDGEMSDVIVGSTGVFVVQKTGMKASVELPNYATYSNRLKSQYNTRVTSNAFEALKNSVVIKDNRSRFY
jgi:peptidyl-prolyl cis-trans isomerase D